MDEKLEMLFCEGETIKELSGIFGRNDGAIRSRIKKLELKEKYDSYTHQRHHQLEQNIYYENKIFNSYIYLNCKYLAWTKSSEQKLQIFE
jgi:hypothetical protein